MFDFFVPLVSDTRVNKNVNISIFLQNGCKFFCLFCCIKSLDIDAEDGCLRRGLRAYLQSRSYYSTWWYGVSTDLLVSLPPWLGVEEFKQEEKKIKQEEIKHRRETSC